MKKALVLSALLASGMLVACSNGSTSSSATVSSTPSESSVSVSASAPSSSQSEQVKALYQVSASYDELYDMFGAFEFYGLLNSDGTGNLYKAFIQSTGEKKNLPQVDEEVTTFKYKITSDDGIDSLEASLGGKKYTGYKNKDGNFVLQGYSFRFAGAYSRTVDLIVSETISYKTESEWETGITALYANRTVEVKVNNTFKGPVLYADGEHAGEPFMINFGSYGVFAAEAKIELNSDFTLNASYGVGGSNGGATFEGTWTANESQCHVLTIGDAQIVGEMEGEHEKLVWNFAHQAKDAEGNPVGDPINLTSTLDWVAPEE